MERTTSSIIDRLRKDLDQFPDPVGEAFDNALLQMQHSLSEDQMLQWAEFGSDIANQTVRSWEAASNFFKVSPAVVRYMPFSYFIKWISCGSILCRDSPTVGDAYFQASPMVMNKLRSRHIEDWAKLGRGLYKGTWKSSTLACKFFTYSPVLLDSLEYQELERFVFFIDALSRRSYDLSSECLSLGQQIFPLVGEDTDAFISVATTLVETSWREVKSFFEVGSRALPRIEAQQRVRFLRLCEELVKSGGTNISTTMLDTSQAFTELDQNIHSEILELAETLLGESNEAMPEFVKVCPQILERLPVRHLRSWYDEGIRVLKANKDGGLAYFRIESSHSEEILDNLSSGVDYERVKSVMEMYCRGLAGAEIKLASTQELTEKNIGWVSNESPSTEGSTVYVPILVDRYPSKAQNFSWFKVVSTHQVGHLEFGSFLFDFDEPSKMFKNLRHDVETDRVANQKYVDNNQIPEVDSLEHGWLTDMQRFFNLFEDRKLALDIFTVLEDARLDSRIKHEYPGIRESYNKVQVDTCADRPDIHSLPAREALVEFMVRISLQQYKDLPAPEQYVDQARQIAGITTKIIIPSATVEDSAEATLRVYAIVSQIANEHVPPEDWHDLDIEEEDEEYQDPENMEQLLQQISAGTDMEMRPEGEDEYDSTSEVEYRGDFKPELVQLLTQLRMQQEQAGEGTGDSITAEQLEELLKNSAELDLQAMQGEIQNSSGTFADNILKETALNLPQSPESSQGGIAHIDEEGSGLESSEPQTFVYDEWDFRADDYKPRWCIVKQKVMQEGDPAYFGATLNDYGSLVMKIRRQFELMVPDTLRKVRKLEDGEEIDIDDLIEAMVDIKTGVSPSEKFYWRRNKVQRDVAVAFLLDTSASTAEAIDDGKKNQDDWDAPDDPVEYMVWLRTRRGEAMRRSYKRIIDVEKESIVLLINALEAIGDMYGIYGFSGYGRENVEFFTIKDLDENFSDRVKRRIDRIAPLHATRMGPAIRHATHKLEQQDARTKLLFLISDGRPQDRGYSREGVEKEYAVHDTKMAIDEAKAKEINAFCLTVDKNGHDYLKTMCQDIGYEVLDDIYALPERLLYLYRRLTM